MFLNKIFSVFQNSSHPNINKNYWGRDFILELIGNVFIPLFFRMSIINQSFGFQEYLKQLYLDLPATQQYGRLRPFDKLQKVTELVS